MWPQHTYSIIVSPLLSIINIWLIIWFHKPRKYLVSRISDNIYWDIYSVNCFSYRWQQLSGISLFVERWVYQHPSIMYTTWPSSINITEATSVVNNSLNEARIQPHVIIIISMICRWRRNRYMRAIYCSNALWHTSFSFKIINILPLIFNWRKEDVLVKQMIYNSLTSFMNYFTYSRVTNTKQMTYSPIFYRWCKCPQGDSNTLLNRYCIPQLYVTVFYVYMDIADCISS